MGQIRRFSQKFYGEVVSRFMVPNVEHMSYTSLVQEHTGAKRLAELPNDYFVSDEGKVYRLKRDRICTIYEVRQTKTKAGYMQVSNPFKSHCAIPVHRLVAIAFIPNWKKLPCVDHKDRNKENNSISNLRWCTYKENMNFYYKEQKTRAI